MSDNLVEINSLSFAYEQRPVLKDININIPRGKVVAIMGLSGCGKTTTLRLIRSEERRVGKECKKEKKAVV